MNTTLTSDFNTLYLTPEMPLKFGKSLLLVLTHQLGYQFMQWNTSTLVMRPRELTPPLISTYAAEFGITTRTVRNRLPLTETYTYAGRMAMLPVSSWNRFKREAAAEPYQTQVSLTTVWIYLITQCWLYQDFSQSAAEIGRNLRMAQGTLTRAIKWLIEHRFIALKHERAHFRNVNLARVYQLYDVDVPAAAKSTMWFIGHLAKFEVDE